MTLRETIKKYIEVNNIRYDGDFSELDAVLQDNDIEPVKGGQPPIIVDVQEVGRNLAISGKQYNFNINISLDYDQTTYYFFTINLILDTDHTHIKAFTLKFNAIEGQYWTYINPVWVNFHAVGSYLRLDDSQGGDIDTDYHDGQSVTLAGTDTTTLYPGFYTNYFDGEQHLSMRINDGCRFDIFKDVDSARDYYRDGITDGLLNDDNVVSKRFEYFIKNTVYKNGKLYFYRDYKFKTDSQTDPHCMALVRNDSVGYDHILNGQNSSHITQISSRGRSDSANEYAPTSSAPTEYLRYSQETAGGNDYTVSFWRTNIHCFDNQNDADDYISTGNTENSTNNQDVNRANNTIVDGHIGDVVSQTDNGSCKMAMVSGSKIYAVTSLALSAFFNNVLFNNDAVTQGKTVMEQVLDGTQMFGANQINAIGGCLYLPLDIDDIATTSDVTHATIGSYIADLNGKQVLKNNKMINCGTVFFEAPYGDWRDYECKLFCILPFCGMHELNISAYINSNVTLKYAVDVTSGACTAYLYSNNKIVDAFDGSMGVSRPLTAVNQQAQADAVVNGIISTATSTAKTIGTAGTAMIGGSALSSATTGAKAISAGGEIANAGSNFGGGVQGTILQAYNTLQSAIDQPMTNRGGFAGILGQFGNMSPYFVFAWQKNSKPANELETVGLPSNAGGAVGGFGGFLQCSAFNLANGFSGTDAEANEIYSAMSSGVYVS